MSSSLGVIVGGAAGGLGLAILAVGLLWFCVVYCRNHANKNSDSASSDPPAQEGNRGGDGGCGPPAEPRKARRFSLEELEQATKNFTEHNLIGNGSFGLVYKGLLCDGTVVAVKRRRGSPKQEFVEEVHFLAEIWHRNLVTLIGYCQEAGLQMLVFEYLPNGSICNHLHDTRKGSVTKLEFKQRLSVAIGAAKGLSHLHSLIPPLVHRDFKTNNVLVDENFIAKVADAGMVRLLRRIEDAGPSQASAITVYQDPEAGEFGAPSETGDVYSFGVFLLELVTGQEAEHLTSSESSECLAHWVKAHLGSDELLDPRMSGSYTSEGMRDFFRLILQCLDVSGRQRPRMGTVVSDLDRILETEMALTTVRGDGSATVTLGSQLFTSA